MGQSLDFLGAGAKITFEDFSDIDSFADEEPIIFNDHPLNQKAKAHLQKHSFKPLNENELYILQLIYFGLQNINKGMRQQRQQIGIQNLMLQLEDKITDLRWGIKLQETMRWLIIRNDLSSYWKLII